MSGAPFLPMEARQVTALPTDDQCWQFEPKWDGFRCLAVVQDGKVDLWSKAGKPLGRYFPDVVDGLAGLPDIVLDGELIIPVGAQLSFDALQQRLHPAASRVAKLAGEQPARYMVFDHLTERDSPLSVRRARLEAFYDEHRSPMLRLSPRTSDSTTAQAWLERAGGALDGVVVKRRDEPYQPGERAMLKVKRLRTADCVIGGYRSDRGGKVVSLLLGLFEEDGTLRHVGFTAALARLDPATLRQMLEPLHGGSGFASGGPDKPSRWNRGEERAWQPVRAELVVEVRYDHVSGGRFRHGTAFLRWRPDKSPAACRIDQLSEEAAPAVVAQALKEPL